MGLRADQCLWRHLASDQRADADGAFAVDDDCDEGQELQVDFGSLGLWRYDDAGGAGTWQQFSPFNPHLNSRMDTYSYGYEEGCWLLPAHGVWRMWWWISVLEDLDADFCEPFDPNGNTDTGVADEELAVDRGASGLWLYDSTGGHGPA